jgi:hypothetical protein
MTIAHTTNEKDPRVTSTGPFENHTTNDIDFPTLNSPSKALVTIKAKFALRGHSVHDGSDRDFIVVQKDWGHSRYCRDYAALIGFGRLLGVL